FRYADSLDIFLMVIGAVASVVHGAGLPVLFIFFGELTTVFTNFGLWNATIAPEYATFRDTSVKFVLYFVYVACAVLVFASVQVGTWSLSSVRQSKHIQIDFFRSVLRQDMAFHDVKSSGELNARLSKLNVLQDNFNYFRNSDVKKIKDGMAEKVSMVLQYTSMSLTGIIVGLIYAWKLALVTLSVAPLLGLASTLIKMQTNCPTITLQLGRYHLTTIYTKRELAAYATAGTIAEEAISAIRTVVAFGCQDKEVDRYTHNLGDAKVVGIKRGLVSGFSMGLLYLSMFGMYGLSFWYGTTLVLNGEIAVGNMITSFFNILIAAFGLGMAGSYLDAFSSAKAAGSNIFDIIDRKPVIDPFSKEGDSPNPDSGSIQLKNVRFTYPSRPDVKILKGVSLTVEHGKTVALVGQSGCGKSTIIQLIQRFYDVQEGSLEVGGKDVSTLNVRKLREMIGVVAQEPILFATSIAENIRWGREGVTNEEIEKAARQANAYNFIMNLPEKFQTLVGERGGQMSGGQKQRIAIARAIVRNPKVLLLDEATSALDTKSESVVQQALEKASAGMINQIYLELNTTCITSIYSYPLYHDLGPFVIYICRTTVVVAHRLSTIRSADKIFAFHEGQIMEEGSHEELLLIKDGVYSNLINMQAGRESEESEEKDSAGDFKKNQNSVKMRTYSQRSNNIESKKSGKIGEDDEEEEEEDIPDVSFGRIIAMNKPEWYYMAGGRNSKVNCGSVVRYLYLLLHYRVFLISGCVFAAIAGAADPVNAILFAEVLTVFSLSDVEEQKSKATLYALLFVAVGVIVFIAYCSESTLFAKSGMELTVRLRKKAFKAMLRQDIAYFDDHRHSPGALCTRLSMDASRVQGCTGVRIGTIIKNFSSLGVALGIAFAYGWKLTLLTIAFIPFLILGGLLEMQLVMGAEEKEGAAYEEAGQIAGEAINNIRTVASLTKEQTIYELYTEKLAGPLKKSTRKALLVGLGYGYSQCVIYFAYAAVFRLGIELVLTYEMTYDNVFKVLTAVIFGAMAVGQNSSFAPDYAEAKVSAKRMFALFDRTPEIDVYSDNGASPAHCKGEITLKSVRFHYPTRPDLPVLKGLDITIKPGQTLALVGQSGCGKSTTVQLLERFYDADEGEVSIDGCDIKKLNIKWVRQQMGLVSQEPMLFNQSIKENILYGDCSRSPTNEEVNEAAKNANIKTFIDELPDKFETSVGLKGGQLSGGQKQRIAIARALLRNPKILLLDEATSALDTESEKVYKMISTLPFIFLYKLVFLKYYLTLKIVQEALDAARAGRTSIVVAHRLSTVKNADQIAVVDNGVVVEVGTHEQLIATKGAYFSLVNAQL
uniref:Bile salt export pump n=1 Tax=Ciona savignyi TaxID=51511 RepID=H2ZPW4_CIOSA